MARTVIRRVGVVAVAVLGLAIVAACSRAPTGSGTASTPDPSTVVGRLDPRLPDGATKGPLAPSEQNSRYFVDESGRAVFLTGAHTWLNRVDYGPAPDDLVIFDYPGYLEFLVSHGHNFVRLWAWEQATYGPWTDEAVVFSPTPYVRAGPGLAADGLPKFDLTRFDQAYFDRLRERVVQARERGVYVAVMLFNGFSVDAKGQSGNPCRGHPFNAANNVNGISADLDGDGSCAEAHTLADAQITALQKRYVAEVVDTVGDLDNVLYEISNESNADSTDWQEEMIRTVRQLESESLQHPVGFTSQYPGGANDTLLASSADWISPNDEGDYKTDPPAAPAGQPVSIVDTDHLWGVGGDERWVWQSVTRGHNVIYMDCYDNPDTACDAARNDPARMLAIENMGYARRVLDELDLTATQPAGDVASSGFALHDSSSDSYVVYLPEGGQVDVTLERGDYETTWLDPADGTLAAGTSVTGGERRSLRSPFADQAVLVVSRAEAPADLTGSPSAGS